MRKKRSGILLPVRRGHGGVSVPHYKNTANLPAVKIPPPERVILPMRQHIGAPCEPLVKQGDRVRVGQIIGDSEKYISAPVHASVSGEVTAVREVRVVGGACLAVEIASDGLMTPCEEFEVPRVRSRKDLIAAVRQSGLVGLGGAGFPTHAKLDIPKEKKIDTLIVNAAECEPFITVDYRECIDNSWDIMSGINLIQEMLRIPNVIISAEDNKPEAFAVLNAIASNSMSQAHGVQIMALPSRYPQGAEKVLVNAVTGRKIPPDGLPLDVGVLVMNVTSTAFLSRYVKTGKPLVSRSLTVDGDGVREPKNVRVPLGTPIKDIIAFCGGYRGDVGKMLVGGPMMGFAVDSDELPVTKQNNAVLVFSKAFAGKNGDPPCIRCGRCASVCPMNLVPTQIERYTKEESHERLKRSGVNLCMECGCCAYSCPAHRPLVQYMRYAKELNRRER